MSGGPETARTTSRDGRKNANKLRNRQSKKSSRRNEIHSITLELNYVNQGWPNVAHCMVGGGAFDVSGNLRKCAYRCPEKFVTDY